MAKTRVSTGTIGQIVSSLLTEVQFQAANGTGWILMDGRSVAGSTYATVTGNTTVPDARGMVLRGKNNGRSDGNENPAADRALGDFENDQMQGHRHNINRSDTVSSGGVSVANGPGLVSSNTHIKDPVDDGTNGSPRTGRETRMKNITVNHFIKIN